MNPILVGALGFIFMFVLMLFRMPIGLSLGVAGLLGTVYLRGWEKAFNLMAGIPYNVASSYDMSAIPLFVIMASFLFYAEISSNLYDAGRAWLGGLKGGLAMATSVACGLFGAVCGSSIVAAITIGTVAIPEMKRFGYNSKLYTGCVAAGGTVADLIPPSMPFIFYALLTGESIGKLFIAGIIPGVIQVILFMIIPFAMCTRNPSLGPAGPRTSLKQKVVSLKGIWPTLVLFIVVIGGLYAGIFTATESAAVGAGGALLIMISMKRFTFKKFGESLLDTGKFASMAFLILLGSMIFNAFIVSTRLPNTLALWVSTLQLPAIGVLIVILAIYFILGCVMDVMAMTVLTIPIFFPIITALGYDPIWFGVIFVVMAEIGLITPPMGMNVYVITGVAKDVPMQDVFKGIFPYVGAMLLLLIALIIWPDIALVLPNVMK